MTSIGDKYDSIAKRFADMRSKNLLEKKYFDLLIKNLPAHASILDVGSGAGEPIIPYLLEQGFTLTGLDASKQLIKIAEEKFPSVEYIHGDMRIVSVPQKYDAIVAWDCLPNLPKEDQKYMLPRFASWLAHGGKILFTTGDEDTEIENQELLGEQFSYYSFSPDTYILLLAAAGFEILLNEKGEENHYVWLVEYKGLK